MRRSAEAGNFRVMGPDETASNQLSALFEVTDLVSTADVLPMDDHIGPDGRVMEVLSEHMCDLHCRITDCSQAGFNMAMDVSCHSFIRMARMAEPLMPRGGCLLTVTFYGSEKDVEEYNLMGPVKAALESSVRYMAAELGPKRIRVHALSPGPLKTRAASGINQFDEFLECTRSRTPEHQLVSIEDVGNVAAFLVRNAAAALTGNIEYIDGGYHILC